jgi:hypothetical protein
MYCERLSSTRSKAANPKGMVSDFGQYAKSLTVMAARFGKPARLHPLSFLLFCNVKIDGQLNFVSYYSGREFRRDSERRAADRSGT